jgi:hypothetical protein
MKAPIIFSILFLGLVGCGTPEPYDGMKRAPRADIDAYEAGKEPTRPYKVIMSFSEEGSPGDEADRHRKFVKQAKQLGADGIIFKAPTTGAWSFGAFGGGTKTSFTATAIVYETAKP